jgi:Heavy metal associated domain 2
VQSDGAAAMKPRLKIAHQVPGRIRMKIPSAKGNAQQLEQYRETLSLIPGIERVEVNPETGSIVLKYDPDRRHDFHAGFHDHVHEHHGYAHHKPPTNEIDALASKIEEEAEYLAEHSQVARVLVDFCKNADRQIRTSSDNMLDLKMLLAIGVVGFTVFEVGATAATPVWVTLALFGMNHFIEMQEQLAEAKAAQAAVRA